MQDNTKHPQRYVLTLTGSVETRKRLLGGKRNIVGFFESRGADSVSVKPDLAGRYNPIVEVRLRAGGNAIERITTFLRQRVGGPGVPLHVVVEEGQDTDASSHEKP